MESGAKWASFITGVALLAIAAVMLARDWLAGDAISFALPVVLGLLGAMALAVGMSRAPLDPRAAREMRQDEPAAEQDRDSEPPRR
jgi:hypothetical protein